MRRTDLKSVDEVDVVSIRSARESTMVRIIWRASGIRDGAVALSRRGERPGAMRHHTDAMRD
jgi:hypothetical protein